jgi:hypothetical protein
MDHGMDQISEVISPGGDDQVSIEGQNALYGSAISECAEFAIGFVPRGPYVSDLLHTTSHCSFTDVHAVISIRVVTES